MKCDRSLFARSSPNQDNYVELNRCRLSLSFKILPNGSPTLAPEFPGHSTTAHHRGHRLPDPLLDHGSPRHEAEAHAVVEHGEGAARQQHVATIDAGHALAIHRGVMRQAGLSRDSLGCRVDVSAA